MSVNEIVTAILAGQWNNNDLDRMAHALREAGKMERAKRTNEAISKFKKGDVVEIDGISPKRLNGIKGEIASFGKGHTRVDIKITDSCAAFGPQYNKGSLLRGIPIQCLREVK